MGGNGSIITSNSASSTRRVSRKEMSAVDVVKACKYVATPPEPLALRLSSQLMVGVARVYLQQTNYFHGNFLSETCHRVRHLKKKNNKSVFIFFIHTR